MSVSRICLHFGQRRGEIGWEASMHLAERNSDYSAVPTDEFDDETEDDTVFVKDPTIHLKPLMHPKRRKKTIQQVTGRAQICCGQRNRRSSLVTCVFVLVLVVLVAFLLIYIYRNTMTSIVAGLVPSASPVKHKAAIKSSGCDKIEVTNVWTSYFPTLMSESAARLVEINNDGVLDVIIGFGTGVDSLSASRIKCDIYFDGKFPCFGGLLAVDGRSGEELWRNYDIHEIFAINCQVDLNGDDHVDCIGAGRGAAFSAFDSRDGTIIWSYRGALDGMNFYTPQAISDLDEDGVPEFVQVHGGDPVFGPGQGGRPTARLLLVSGRTGQLVLSHKVPDGFESYYSPQIVSLGVDGGDLGVLLGTGGETHGGSLYLIRLRELVEAAGRRKGRFHTVYEDRHKGVTTPPALVDVNGDGQEDIVMAMFNSTVIAFDGRSPHQQLWRFKMPHPAESYNTPAVGFFNNDDVPDIAVQYSVGPGYPVYYNSQVLILDGTNGDVIGRPSVSNTGIQASPLTVSFKDLGDDLLVFWSQHCRGHEEEMRGHKFSGSYSQAEMSRAHLCKIKFNTTTITRFVLSSREGSQTVLYNSEAEFHKEYKVDFDSTSYAREFARRHPVYQPDFEQYLSTREAPQRVKRHVGPHDSEGLQRAISTGTLAPSATQPEPREGWKSSSIDVIFSTYWSTPSEAKLSTPEEDECVNEWMKFESQRLDPHGRFYGMDHDHYQLMVAQLCQRRYGHRTTRQQTQNVFDIHVGQLSVYRRRITCSCKERPDRKCPTILPYQQQGWAAYLGTFGNSHWNRKARQR